MRKTTVLCSILAAAFLVAGRAWADDAKKEAKEEPKAEGTKIEQPEVLEFTKTNKMAPVKFMHKVHSDKLKGCKDCHEGEKPLFKQKRREEVYKMADMYKGESCGACHDGKKAFAAKTGCMKCHKK